MALQAGRVGVDPSQVDKRGKVIGGGGGSYTLPTASAQTKGGIKIGNNLTMSGEVLSADSQLPAHAAAQSGKYLKVDSNGDLVWADKPGGGGVESGTAVPTSQVGSDGDIYLYYVGSDTLVQMDTRPFSRLFGINVKFGDYGSKVDELLKNTDETQMTSWMQQGWNESHAAYYNAENIKGAYGGYDFGKAVNVGKIRAYLGRYVSQNTTLIVTVEYLDSLGNWNELEDVEITSSLSYPLNYFDVTINRTIYGVRWIHKKDPVKSTNNNLTFFGMTVYENVLSGTILNAYAKVNGAWQELIGTEIQEIID